MPFSQEPEFVYLVEAQTPYSASWLKGKLNLFFSTHSYPFVKGLTDINLHKKYTSSSQPQPLPLSCCEKWNKSDWNLRYNPLYLYAWLDATNSMDYFLKLIIWGWIKGFIFNEFLSGHLSLITLLKRAFKEVSHCQWLASESFWSLNMLHSKDSSRKHCLSYRCNINSNAFSLFHHILLGLSLERTFKIGII